LKKKSLVSGKSPKVSAAAKRDTAASQNNSELPI